MQRRSYGRKSVGCKNRAKPPPEGKRPAGVIQKVDAKIVRCHVERPIAIIGPGTARRLPFVNPVSAVDQEPWAAAVARKTLQIVAGDADPDRRTSCAGTGIVVGRRKRLTVDVAAAVSSRFPAMTNIAADRLL